MATKNGADVFVKTDDVVQSAIAAAMSRIAEVGATPSLVMFAVQQGWKDWDESAANILVSDYQHSDISFADDDTEEVPEAA